MYIVIETFDRQFPTIVCDEDGYPLIFDNEEDAQAEAGDLQLGIVVEY